MQELINELSKGWRAERSLSQMTLGKLIDELEKLPQEKQIVNICSPHSYRGYYSDLALERQEGTRTVGSLLEQLKKECLEQTFRGYKGGDFYMDEHTPMWVADYGDTGLKIIGLDIDLDNDLIFLKLADNIFN